MSTGVRPAAGCGDPLLRRRPRPPPAAAAAPRPALSPAAPRPQPRRAGRAGPGRAGLLEAVRAALGASLLFPCRARAPPSWTVGRRPGWHRSAQPSVWRLGGLGPDPCLMEGVLAEGRRVGPGRDRRAGGGGWIWADARWGRGRSALLVGAGRGPRRCQGWESPRAAAIPGPGFTGSRWARRGPALPRAAVTPLRLRSGAGGRVAAGPGPGPGRRALSPAARSSWRLSPARPFRELSGGPRAPRRPLRSPERGRWAFPSGG